MNVPSRSFSVWFIRGIFFALLSQGALSSAAPGADLAREQRMATEIVDAIFDGEPLSLETSDGLAFLGIWTAADTPVGGAIIMHGRGFHPDWVDTVNPLRVGLVDAGWSTLSIQMPVLAKTAKYNDYVPIFSEAVPRIDAAIAQLRAQGVERIALIAHSCSAHMLQHWIVANGDRGIAAMVGIGLGATDYQQPMQEAFVLDRLGVPFLDIYGGEEYPAVKRLAPERLRQMTVAGNVQSRQIVVPGADHYFRGKGAALTKTIANWLNGLD